MSNIDQSALEIFRIICDGCDDLQFILNDTHLAITSISDDGFSFEMSEGQALNEGQIVIGELCIPSRTPIDVECIIIGAAENTAAVKLTKLNLGNKREFFRVSYTSSYPFFVAKDRRLKVLDISESGFRFEQLPGSSADGKFKDRDIIKGSRLFPKRDSLENTHGIVIRATDTDVAVMLSEASRIPLSHILSEQRFLIKRQRELLAAKKRAAQKYLIPEEEAPVPEKTTLLKRLTGWMKS